MTPARRQFLGYGLASAAAAATIPPLANALYPKVREVDLPPADLRDALPPTPPAPLATKKPAIEIRRAFVHNLHTGDVMDTVYYENGAYVPDALHAAMRVLRDWRSGEEHFMDPRLFDLMHKLRQKIEVRGPFQIVSGYRSAKTNAMMRLRSHEVAEHSQHILGKAVDIGLEGVDLGRLHQAALSLRAGGVGYYPKSGFVHVDVGPVRQWEEA
ncbi:MAG TPA: DUF882 domain-containing protein [Caulobacteraceae bacterium]|jgi:uncharacterized protein YcbK (DUF882 family)|nr:DUF882 domain-containing protein [Caulobacteraceae bacterium]